MDFGPETQLVQSRMKLVSTNHAHTGRHMELLQASVHDKMLWRWAAGSRSSEDNLVFVFPRRVNYYALLQVRRSLEAKTY